MTITVAGVDIDGQWLRYTTNASSGGTWQLAHTSPRGGFIVEQVSRTILERGGWFAHHAFLRQVLAGVAGSSWSGPPADATDDVPNTALAGSTGDESVSAVARFYEGLTLPPAFAVGNSPFAGARVSSMTDPNLSTSSATLPVITSSTQKF